MAKTVIENRHKCPRRLWNKFSEKGKIAYNNVRGVKRDIITPNKSLSEKEWEAISHNYACFSAWEF